MGAYWPDGVTQPQHLWPFFQTNDYSDQGSTGGLTLTAQGSGNSFDENGLNLNGSGYAQYNGTDADLNDLGSTWSLIIEVYSTTIADLSAYISTNNNDATGGFEWYMGPANVHFYLYNAGWYGGGNIYAHGTEVSEQHIATLSDGNLKFYKDGSYQDQRSSISDPASTTNKFTVAAEPNGLWKLPSGSYIKRVGILKGTAWTSDDVAAIYAWSPESAGEMAIYIGGSVYIHI